ncbi:MAG: hypothetical protein QMB63_06830 [Clostridiaceae bacterium]
MKKIEVIATFQNEGRIVPRRVRYYDESEAEYIVKDIVKIYFEERSPYTTRYLVSIDEAGEDISLIFDEKKATWYKDN